MNYHEVETLAMTTRYVTSHWMAVKEVLEERFEGDRLKEEMERLADLSVAKALDPLSVAKFEINNWRGTE